MGTCLQSRGADLWLLVAVGREPPPE